MLKMAPPKETFTNNPVKNNSKQLSQRIAVKKNRGLGVTRVRFVVLDQKVEIADFESPDARRIFHPVVDAT